MNKLLICISFFYLIGCKPKPFKAIEDSAWRDETVEITSDLCKKFEICSESLILNLPKNMQNHVKEEISFSNCIEKNKKSNIYKLAVPNINEAKIAFRECANFIKNLSCEDLSSGKIKENEFCKSVTLIQSNKY